MGKKRKITPTPGDDPHGWLVEVLRGDEAHSVKAQRAVTALTGYGYIAGVAQDAGSDRPFDHKAPDDSIRIDTKTQQGGELDVKKEKASKQFTAWANSGKKFIPVQLVLDSLTGTWYVVPGIPSKTVTLDPHATTFDPNDPTAAFAVAEGSLDELSEGAAFLDLKDKLLAALSLLLREKERIMKVVDADYLRYVSSLAEDAIENPDLLEAIFEHEKAPHAIAQNEDAVRAIAREEAARRIIAEDAIENPDLLEAIFEHEKAPHAIAQNEDAVRAIAREEDARRAIAKDDETVRAIARDEAGARAIANDEEVMRRILSPKMFELWKKEKEEGL